MIKVLTANSGAYGHTCRRHSIQPFFNKSLVSGHSIQPNFSKRLIHQTLFHDSKNLKAMCASSKHSVEAIETRKELEFTGVHHVGMLCENLERSLNFYQGVLGLELNPDRPADRLPYRGAWFWVGAEMIHLMELPNPDPVSGRPTHGGRDRHACVAIKSLDPLKNALEKAGVPYTLSMSGRPAIFTRDPDGNALEFSQT